MLTIHCTTNLQKFFNNSSKILQSPVEAPAWARWCHWRSQSGDLPRSETNGIAATRRGGQPIGDFRELREQITKQSPGQYRDTRHLYKAGAAQTQQSSRGLTHHTTHSPCLLLYSTNTKPIYLLLYFCHYSTDTKPTYLLLIKICKEFLGETKILAILILNMNYIQNPQLRDISYSWMKPVMKKFEWVFYNLFGNFARVTPIQTLIMLFYNFMSATMSVGPSENQLLCARTL